MYSVSRRPIDAAEIESRASELPMQLGCVDLDALTPSTLQTRISHIAPKGSVADSLCRRLHEGTSGQHHVL